MKKFELIADVTVSIYTTVEAETFEEAKLIAGDREIVAYEFSRRGGSKQSDESWVNDEYDGSPENIHEA